METLTYPYRPNALVMAFVSLCCAALAAIMANTAATNDTGLVINSLSEFSAPNATLIYGVMAASCLGLAVLGLLGLRSGLKPARMITLNDTSITAPKGLLGNAMVSVPYANILDLKRQIISRQDLLYIYHSTGTLNLSLNALKNKLAREEFLSALSARLRLA